MDSSVVKVSFEDLSDASREGEAAWENVKSRGTPNLGDWLKIGASFLIGKRACGSNNNAFGRWIDSSKMREINEHDRAASMQLALNRDLVLKLANVRPLLSTPQYLVPTLKAEAEVWGATWHEEVLLNKHDPRAARKIKKPQQRRPIHPRKPKPTLLIRSPILTRSKDKSPNLLPSVNAAHCTAFLGRSF
jgi:hypothetical protein